MVHSVKTSGHQIEKYLDKNTEKYLEKNTEYHCVRTFQSIDT